MKIPTDKCENGGKIQKDQQSLLIDKTCENSSSSGSGGGGNNKQINNEVKSLT